ncbi:MAG: hypothetical protein K1X57_07425 [Gemmataceae bacterium]|nr:hypothetical protein [Gemmataceae bacterium]
MSGVWALLVASAAIPLGRAWVLNRGWTVRHALAWAWAAWTGWIVLAITPGRESAWLALTLTSAAGIAVLGARRPIIGMWHFLVASLLVVLWLGFAEGLLDGSGLKLGAFRLTFVAVLLCVGFGNYVMTRWGVIVMTMIAPALTALFLQAKAGIVVPWPAGLVSLGLWAAMVWPSPKHRSEWQRFRDRYGAVWALRLREQFQAAAFHRGWPVTLSWRGLQSTSDTVDPAWESAVEVLMKRFRSTGELQDLE